MQIDARLFIFFSYCRNSISAISTKKFEKSSRNKIKSSFEGKITNVSENYSTKPSQSASEALNDNDEVELGSTKDYTRNDWKL